MRTSVLRASIVLFCGLVPIAAHANPAFIYPPEPRNCDAPCAIVLVPAPASSPLGTFEIVLRDRYQNPVAFEPVTVDFSACGADVRIAQQQGPGMIVTCGAKQVSGITDAQGRFTFQIIGGSSGAPATVHAACARIRSDTWGVNLGTVQVAIYDLNGSNGITGADLSAFLADFFASQVAGSCAARSDYTFIDGGCTKHELTAADLSRWLDVFFSLGGTTYGVPYCTP